MTKPLWQDYNGISANRAWKSRTDISSEWWLEGATGTSRCYFNYDKCDLDGKQSFKTAAVEMEEFLLATIFSSFCS